MADDASDEAATADPQPAADPQPVAGPQPVADPQPAADSQPAVDFGSADEVASYDEESAAASKDPEQEPPSKLRRRLMKALSLFLGLVAALALGECVTRIAMPPVRGISWYHNDARYGFRHRAGLDQVTREWGENEPWRTHTNSHGFRGPEWPMTSSGHRVVIVGDSFTFANGVEWDDSFGMVAQTKGRERWSALETVNLGVSAWGPQNALAYIETEGEALTGECLIYAFFEGNDVLEGFARKLYEMRDGEWQRAPVKAIEQTGERKIQSAARSIPGYEYLLEHSQLFNLIRRAVMSQMVKGKAEQRNIFREPTDDELKEAYPQNVLTLNRMKKVAGERFGSMALMLIPMRGQIDGSDDKKALPFPRAVAEESHQRVVAWAKEQGVPVLDLHARFSERKDEVASYYFVNDFHFSVAGNHVVGQWIAAELPRLCPKLP